MTQNDEQSMPFTSLHDISVRKAQILKAIRKDQKDISKEWNEIFKKPESRKGKGMSMTSIVSNSIGLLDGALFAWKLYRKFKKK